MAEMLPGMDQGLMEEQAPEVYIPSHDEYWAGSTDQRDLARRVIEKADRFREKFRSTQLYSVLTRNWSYYHGDYFPGSLWKANPRWGKNDALVFTACNFLRNFLEHAHSMGTQARPSFMARCSVLGYAAESQVQNAQSIIQHYLKERRLEQFFIRAFEHALVLNTGLIYAPWDWSLGAKVMAQGGLETSYEGDFGFKSPTVFDYAFDTGAEDEYCQDWVIVVTYENRWKIAEYVNPEDRHAVLGTKRYDSNFDPRFALCESMRDEELTDYIPVYHFHHRDTPHLSGGVDFHCTAEDVPVSDIQENPYDKGYGLPLFTLQPKQIVGSRHGWSVANDLAGPQELLNSEISAVTTNHQATSMAGIAVPSGWELKESQFKDGVFCVRQTESSGQNMMPGGISFTTAQTGRMTMADWLNQAMEYISGINSVVRGEPESSLKSGEALKVMEAKALQFGSQLQGAYYMMQERMGTHIFKTLQRFVPEDPRMPGAQRQVSLYGDQASSRLPYFDHHGISAIDRIEVEAQSAMAVSTAGRLAIAEMYMGMGWCTTPEEFTTVLTTGRLEPLMKAERNQILKIRRENEKLRRLEPVDFNFALDHHVLHAREHNAELADLDPDRDGPLIEGFLSHIMQHVGAIQQPDVQLAQLTLGYRVPVPPAPPPGMQGIAGKAQTGKNGGEGPRGAVPGTQSPPGIEAP